MEHKQYINDLIYNVDETSLLIKSITPPTLVCNKSKCPPAYSPPVKIFSCTCVFIGFQFYFQFLLILKVDAGGGHAESTLILNENIEFPLLNTFLNNEVDIKFFYI
jgi:hypothetical protein